ncbi:electron transfer flavoprotein subunit beta/FixA family protein [Pseudomonas aeruginosa]|uniref:electron transfer flavoprotein subunit beta/FixA family protein n=1 Tax=Pseudomonas aeruginosa TaxID=287 RepID=UPI000DF79B7F|nr:electron transfer flavoprotein subunit beta/FixA family protein [Pseudomonas aeruginosa]MCU9022845.1 electron transfer flavoprotein subunit beta/FixA family protein [Pseudomonas aeruginosa]MDY1450092.1 electron transfer flavoprotein subunit beta/FixA family protein [Pseudomonas aeruginosa]RDC79486.1 electron transfer flavoprotein subunit beta/FixA family protein [Pseudomonas aeruginosa]HBO5586838.1 electron transfer flavoprotein subunit beta/FixA family protein [Pseudomonas aeruginosa]HEP80
MKILVAVKRVVDANVMVRVKPDGSGVELDSVKMAINPFCEVAVEAAVRLKEAGQVGEVVAVSVGTQACQEQLRMALAMGADRAVLVQAADGLEPLAVAKVLEAIARREQADMVILGKQSIDGDNHQTGQMLAALLGCGQGTSASQISVVDRSVSVSREIDGGLETLRLALPAVITADLRLNEPRYASLPNIMKAKKKPLETVEVATLGVDVAPRLRLLKVAAPAERQAGKRVASVQELVEKLKTEAGVI